MEKISKTRITYSFTLSAVLVVFWILLSTVGAELFSPFKDWLKQAFSHHWIGKGVISAVIFFAGAFIIMPFTKNIQQHRLVNILQTLFWFTVASGILIFVFYLYETFGHI